MPRGTRIPSLVFQKVLKDARAQLEISSERSADFDHSGIRGDERAAALMHFFSDHLPETYAVSKGEAIDCLGNRTGQLDIIIYDRSMAAPISSGVENVLVPAESLLAVIEVKSVLTQDELKICYRAAKKVKKLRPHKGKFVSARMDGAPANDGAHRCLYVVFCYSTNIGQTNWLDKEFKRILSAANLEHAAPDAVDILCVLGNGMIRPGKSAGKAEAEDSSNIFLEFYLHLVNFIYREQSRRPTIDWQMYTTRSSKGWRQLNNDIEQNDEAAT